MEDAHTAPRDERNPNHLNLAGVCFSSGEHLSNRLHDILFKHEIDEQLAPNEAALIADVVKYGHPNGAGKLGDGVKSVKVIIHPEYQTTRCFYIVRKDDTGTDFSYKKVKYLDVNVFLTQHLVRR